MLIFVVNFFVEKKFYKNTYAIVELARDLANELILSGQVLGLEHKGQVGQLLLIVERLALGLDLSLLVLLDDLLIGCTIGSVLLFNVRNQKLTSQIVLLDGVKTVVLGGVLLGGGLVDVLADQPVDERPSAPECGQTPDLGVHAQDFLFLGKVKIIFGQIE